MSVAPSALGETHVPIVLGLTPQANYLPPLRGFGECLSGTPSIAIAIAIATARISLEPFQDSIAIAIGIAIAI